MSDGFRVVARLADLGDPGAREFFVGDGDWPFRGFLVQVDGGCGPMPTSAPTSSTR